MSRSPMPLHCFGDLTSSELPEKLRGKRLILPVGAIEQHGPHLPLTVDIDIAEGLAAELARRLGDYLAPGIIYSARSLPQSGGGPSFPGTIAVRGTTLIRYIRDIVSAYVQSGLRSFVIVNGHYENEPFLMEAMEICRESGRLDGVVVVSLSWWSVVTPELLQSIFAAGFPGWHAEHAGLCETSLMLYLRPEIVRSERPQHARPPLEGIYLHPIDPVQISDRGVLASTSGATAEIGEALFTQISDALASLIGSPHGLAK